MNTRSHQENINDEIPIESSLVEGTEEDEVLTSSLVTTLEVNIYISTRKLGFLLTCNHRIMVSVLLI